ncbi:hypothetical protein ACFPJ4_04205 [Lysinimonas soli]|uniref:Uncharacterized protein n=1 Tax=Lysinimonas soli TaxID=1074233 RepID=A0ABW0NLJ0_9MICO
MTTLTDRYVWAVTRHVPPGRRAVVAERLQTEIAAAVAAKVAAGADPGDAETAVIAELGDPERRAANTEGRPNYLIGPELYFDYRRLMIIVLSAVAASVFGALVLVEVLAGQSLWPMLSTAFSVAFSVTVQVGFWITVAFAVIERVTRGRRPHSREWDVSNLPAIPTTRVGLAETIAAVLAYLLFIGLVIWQRNIWAVETAGGTPLPVLNPTLWDFWIPWFLVLAALEIAFALIAFAIGRWTWTLAWVNVALNLAFAVPAVGLLSSGSILSKQFTTTFRPVEPIIHAAVSVVAVLVVVGAVADIFSGFRKAYLGRAEPPKGGRDPDSADREPAD